MASHHKYLAAFNQLILPTISKVQRLTNSILESEIKHQQLTLAEFRIVGLLMGEEKGYSQKQLAEKLGISAPSLSVSIANLESKDWVQRSSEESDLRIKRIKISPNANFSTISKIITSIEGEVTQGISQKDLKTTLTTLNKIIHNITKS